MNTMLAWYMWYKWRLTLQINGPSRQRGDFIVGFSRGLLGGHNSDMVYIMDRVIKGYKGQLLPWQQKPGILYWHLHNEMLLPL